MATEQTQADSATGNVWGRITFWGLHVWVAAYSVVMLSAFYVQFGQGEYPCPLCMMQRYGMILSTLGAVFLIMQIRRGRLTTSRYAQGLGLGLIGALAGATVSLSQIVRHITPGDPGYGSPFLGIHLYTWALITFAIVMIYCGVALILMPRGIPDSAAAKTVSPIVSSVIVYVFFAVIAANLVSIIFLEGFAWTLPSDPTSYNLFDQLSGR